ncbi:MAG: hypothetical protein AAGI09_03185 [Pseudomonadota bacterium]
MFEGLLSFWIGDFFGGVASTLAVIGAFLTARKWRSNRRAKLYYQWVRSERLLANLPVGYRVKVEFGEQKAERLFTDVLVLSNRTKSTVTDTDFVDLPRIPVSRKGILFEALCIDVGNGAHAEIEVTPDEISIRGLKIPREEVVCFYFAHSGIVEPEIKHLPKSLPEIARRDFEFPDASLMAPLMFPLAVALLWFLNYLDGPEDNGVPEALYLTLLVPIAFSFALLIDKVGKFFSKALLPLCFVNQAELRTSKETVIGLVENERSREKYSGSS